MNKVCIVCKQSLPLESFFKNGKWWHSYCKKCKYEDTNKRNKIRYQDESARLLRTQKRREWLEKRPEYFTQVERRKRKFDPEKIKLDNLKYRTRHPEKFRAHQIVYHAKKKGLLFNQKCRDCDSLKTFAHHPDYSKPLEVMWLCHKHHTLEHIKLKSLGISH